MYVHIQVFVQFFGAQFLVLIILFYISVVFVKVQCKLFSIDDF